MTLRPKTPPSRPRWASACPYGTGSRRAQPGPKTAQNHKKRRPEASRRAPSGSAVPFVGHNPLIIHSFCHLWTEFCPQIVFVGRICVCFGPRPKTALNLQKKRGLVAPRPALAGSDVPVHGQNSVGHFLGCLLWAMWATGVGWGSAGGPSGPPTNGQPTPN